MLVATWFTRQLLFDGAVQGIVFGLLAMGIVLVYRCTRVINFAVANLGMFGAGLLALLANHYGLPYWFAAALALAVGTALGAVVELTVIRRLFSAPRVIVLVATIGIAQLALLLLIALPKLDGKESRFPVPIGAAYEVAKVHVTGPQLTVVLVVPALAALLGWLLNRTAFGKAVKASADNPDLARLASISPKVVSTAVWAVAGALATISVALLGGLNGSVGALDTLGPSTLVRALAAAVLAGMASFPRAFAAGLVIGVIQALVAFNVVKQVGLFDFVVFCFVLAAVYVRSRSSDIEAHTFAYGSKTRPVPEALRGLWWAKLIDRSGFAVLGVIAVLLPIIVTQPSRHLLYTTVLTTAICGLSLTVLTGWGGQVSLGQMAFAGIGAYLTAAFVRGLNVDLKIGSTRLLKAGIQPLPFVVAIMLAVAAVSVIAALIGAVSLRVRGLLLAVTTFAFGLAATQYLYRRPILTGGQSGAVPFRRTTILGIDMGEQRPYYYVALASTVLVVAAVARLRHTGIARTTIAVRDNAITASAYTISPARVKTRAFAIAGGLAALGGGLFAANVQQIPNDRFYQVADSVALVAVVVIGGLGSVGGALLGAAWVVGLPAFFPGSKVVPLLTSSVGLLLLLMYFPGGFVQLAYALRDGALRLVHQRLTAPKAQQQAAAPAVHITRDRTVRNHTIARAGDAGAPALSTGAVAVHYGGLTAVNDVSIEVGRNEVVGLIGTNGAGKTTLMNAISGFVAATGRIELFGTDVSGLAPHQRAARGLGRTFQSATLFPELTVTETVMVALEARHRTRSTLAALVSPAAARTERRRRADAREIIDFLGLGRYADAFIADLSTGTRRIVELSGLLALDARLLCLDEPTAGLAQRETEAFGPLILAVRKELDAAVLVIEHDMPLIMAMSDRVYCLEAGTVIASGDPSTVRNDPAVIASYLGTDERSITRSNAGPP